MIKIENEEIFMASLPRYLKNDIDAFVEGLKNNSTLLDCLWGELYGSINIAQINDCVISEDEANFLRYKYLFDQEAMEKEEEFLRNIRQEAMEKE